MTQDIPDGTLREIDGVPQVYYDGYWIQRYEPPADSLTAKKQLIEALTRRLFNHMEHGINIPGKRLDEVRAAYEGEADPRRKRVKGAMLAGALFNRAADIFTRLVDLEACGVKITPDNDLMHECGNCLREALEFGKLVHHRNGDEGIDELWGEPFKAFTMPVEVFYESRYVKIAMTMRNIDRIATCMVGCFDRDPHFPAVTELIQDYAATARRKCETLRTDRDIFDVWSAFAVAGEAISDFEPNCSEDDAPEVWRRCETGRRLLRDGVQLIASVTRARTPMPLSTEKYLAECDRYRRNTTG